MITLFLLMPAVALFMIANVLVACYFAIQFGYGPPDWRTALNLVVRLTTLQKRLNAGREWIDQKAPWLDKLLDRVHVPKPIVMVEIIDEYETEKETEITDDDPLANMLSADIADMLDGGLAKMPGPEAEPVFYDAAVASALMDKGTEAWLVADKNIETSLMKLNAVTMRSGRFTAEIEGRIRSSFGKTTEEDIKRFVEEIKLDGQNYLASRAEIVQQINQRIEEFGEFKTFAEEIAKENAEKTGKVEPMLKNIEDVVGMQPEEGAKHLLQEISGLRRERHRLHTMEERVFALIADKENRFNTIPKPLFFDDVSGQYGRIGLTAKLNEWRAAKRQESGKLAVALTDFVKFGELNDGCGTLAGDKIVKHFGSALRERFDPANLIGVPAGNCFLIASPGGSLQRMVSDIEHLRQKQAKTFYRITGIDQPVQVLLTCAVIEPAAEQSIEDVFAALEKTMTAAKAAGRNCTFCLQRGASQPEPAETSDMSESEQEITLE
jgi:diguanylate cyclase (GGDEF)-like protein